MLAIDEFLDIASSQIRTVQTSQVDSLEEKHGAVVSSTRLVLQRMRESNEQGFSAAVRDDAFIAMATATADGCHGPARTSRSASPACGRGHLPRRVLDDLERTLDASEAASAAGRDSNPAATGGRAANG